MSIDSFPLIAAIAVDVLAEFGTARLVRSGPGQLELVGGSDLDRAEAREWASLFLDAEYVAWRPLAA